MTANASRPGTPLSLDDALRLVKNFYALGIIGSMFDAMRFELSCIRFCLVAHAPFVALPLEVTKWHFKIRAIVGVYLLALAILYPVDSVFREPASKGGQAGSVNATKYNVWCGST